MIAVPIPATHARMAKHWDDDPPALLALRMEGLEVIPYPCAGPCDYGRMFAELWNEGQKFVVVEHDIVPSPGAVEALLDCPEKHCTHQYPLNQGQLAISFGIGKYDPAGTAPAEWASTPWRMLDGAVLPEVRKRLGVPHVHEPPVAHVRRALI